MFGKIETELFLIPAKETSNMGREQFDCPVTFMQFQITSERFRFPEISMEMTLFASRVR